MNANVKLNTKSGESKSINHSTSQIQIIVRNNNKTCETGNVLMEFVRFQNSFFSFICYDGINKIFYITIINRFLLYVYNMFII
jgi:hypothetical protein